jgi:Carboxymuconolactone decarboxylase family
MPNGTNANLEAISKGDLHVMEKLRQTLEDSYKQSGLDAETFMLVRVAALTATDAAPASWLVNLKIGKELGIEPDRAVGTLIAIAPVVGTARVVSAAGSIVKALDMADELQEMD